MDRIMGAFADSVAAGDYERAEGWLAVARYSDARSSGSTPAPGRGRDRLRVALASARDGHKA
jgi:hypothetical protein